MKTLKRTLITVATLAALAIPALADGLWMGPFSQQTSPGGEYVYIMGEVRNDNAWTVRWCKATVTGKDAGDNLVEVDSAYTEPSDILPGQTATYKVMMRLDERVANWHVHLQGRK